MQYLEHNTTESYQKVERHKTGESLTDDFIFRHFLFRILRSVMSSGSSASNIVKKSIKNGLQQPPGFVWVFHWTLWPYTSKAFPLPYSNVLQLIS